MSQTVSYSEIDTYRQCRLKHQLSYIERWRQTGEEPEALARGTLFHSVMERHYKVLKEARDPNSEVGQYYRRLRSEKSPEEVRTALAEDLYLGAAPMLYTEGTGEQNERQELVEWIYRGYVDTYNVDRDWEVMEVEFPLAFWLPSEGGGRSSTKLAGTVDLIVRWNGGLWIVDHKTCKDLPKPSRKDFDLEDQTAIYAYLLKQHGWDVRGAIYNFCRTTKLKTREMGADERFLRHLTVRSDAELERCALEAMDLMREAYREYNKMVRRDGEEGQRSRTPDGERCGWKCAYTEACLEGRKRPERMRPMLEDLGFRRFEDKPGPTFAGGKNR